MSFFKRGPSRLERLQAASRLQEAIGRAEEAAAGPESPASGYERVCTPQGRIAHYKHPGHGVMCGWPAQGWVPASPSLPVCRMCGMAAEVAGERRAAS